jgi:hypothetical protein
LRVHEALHTSRRFTAAAQHGGEEDVVVSALFRPEELVDRLSPRAYRQVWVFLFPGCHGAYGG